MPITVSIVEDNPDYRLGTACALRAAGGFQVVGEYGSAEAFLDALAVSRPDVVLMDISLPGMSGIAATRRVRVLAPSVQTVVLSVHEDDESVFQAICAGAVGYLAKPVMPDRLPEAIESAAAGGTPMSPHIARRVLEMFRSYVPPAECDYSLTDREIAVLERLVEGDDFKAIADGLFISYFTVRAHLRNIYDKLHVHSKSQAVSKALQERLVHPTGRHHRQN